MPQDLDIAVDERIDFLFRQEPIVFFVYRVQAQSASMIRIH